MKNTTKAAGIAGIIFGILGVAATVAGAFAKGKDSKLTNAEQEFDNELDNFCEDNEETNNTDIPAEEEQAEERAETDSEA